MGDKVVNLIDKLVSIIKTKENVVGAALLSNNERFPFHANDYDYFLLVVSSHKHVEEKISHIEVDGQRVFITTIFSELIDQSTATVTHYNLMDWLITGQIIFDTNDALKQLRDKVMAFPESYKNYRKLREFSGFVETLYLTKKNLHEKNILDAYSQIISAVHYWAHIVLIEEGIHPELTVWQQLRKVHPGVYKLYEELLASPETIEQRVKLVMLACEFTIMNKMKDCCQYLFDTMATREDAWSISDFKKHSELQYISNDLTLVLRRLVQGHYLKEVAELIDIEQNVFEIKYALSQSHN